MNPTKPEVKIRWMGSTFHFNTTKKLTRNKRSDFQSNVESSIENQESTSIENSASKRIDIIAEAMRATTTGLIPLNNPLIKNKS